MALRVMPRMEGWKKQKIISNFPSIVDKIGEYEKERLTVKLSRALLKEEDEKDIERSVEEVIKILSEHRAVRTELFKYVRSAYEKEREEEMFLLREFLRNFKRAKTEQERKNVISKFEDLMRLKIPKTFEVLIDVLELKEETPLLGPITRSRFSFIGDKVIDQDAAIFLVFSGGSAKGTFYNGFIKAIVKHGLWPDYVVGSSAGSIAAASIAYKDLDKVEKAINPKTIGKTFAFHRNILTPFLSLGNGVIGYRLPTLLSKAFGKTKVDEIADCFIITTVPGWRTNIIGVSSDNSLSFSPNIEVSKALWGSCSIPGIIPQPILKDIELNKLWFEGDQLRHAKTTIKFARFEDGNVTQPFPVVTALCIARALKKKALIFAVNLNELTPLEGRAMQYFTLKEHIEIVKKEIALHEKTPKKIMAGIKISLKGFWHWLKQRFELFISGIAPVRAMRANDCMYTHTIINTIRNIHLILDKGEGVVLINPNANGELEGISLSDTKGMAALESYGYKIGEEFASLLLQHSITQQALDNNEEVKEMTLRPVLVKL